MVCSYPQMKDIYSDLYIKIVSKVNALTGEEVISLGDSRKGLIARSYAYFKNRKIYSIEDSHVITDLGRESILPIGTLKETTPQKLKRLLSRLEEKYSFPIVTYNNTKDRRKGFFKEGSVYINLAYATDNTPLHEIYHPFVRVLKLTNEALYEEVRSRAKEIFYSLEDEEAVVEWLSQRKITETFYHKFKNFIISILRKLYILPSNIRDITTIGELLSYLDNPTKEDLISSDLREANSLLNMYPLLNTAKENPYEKIRSWVDSLNIRADGDYYYNKRGDKVAYRVTSFSRDISRSKTDTYLDKRIKKIFLEQGKNPETDTVNIDDTEFTYDQLKKKLENEEKVYAIYGQIIHDYLAYKLSNESSYLDKVKKQLDDLGWSFDAIEETLEGYATNISYVFEHLGLDINQDKILVEVPLMSEDLKYQGLPLASRADLIIITRDGEAILVDWKSGNIFSDANSPFLLSGGEKTIVNDSKLSRASLELVLRSIMLKDKFPSLRFKGLYIAKVSKDNPPYLHSVNLEDFAPVVEKHFSRKIQPSSFFGVPMEVINFREKYSAEDPSLMLMWAYSELKKITYRYSTDQINSSQDLSRKVSFYTKVILELKSLPNVNINYSSIDLPDVTWQLKNLQDIEDPKVSTLTAMLSEAKQAMNEEYQSYIRRHDELLKNLLKQKFSSRIKVLRNILKLPTIIGLLTANPFIFVGSILLDVVLMKMQANTKDVFGFMFIKSTNPSRPGYFLNTTDTYQGRPLTKEEKEYRDFFKETIHSLYKEVWNIPTIDYKGNRSTVGRDSHLPFSLSEDFFPRVPKSLSEIREESSALSFIKDSVAYFFRKYLTDYLDVYVSEQPVRMIPIKYVLPDDSAIISSENHSFDASKAFSLMVTSLLSRKYLDDAYSVSLGLRSLMASEKDFKGNVKAKNFVKFLDSQLSLQFPHHKKDERLLSKPIKVPEKIASFLGVTQDRALTIDASKLSELVRVSTAYTLMGFRFLSSVRNAILITLLNFSRSTNRLFYRIKANGEDYEPTFKDALMTYKDIVGLMKDYITGNLHNNKLFLLEKELSFIPDFHSNLYSVAKGDMLVSDQKKLGISSLAFSIHSMVESYGAYMYLSMLMRGKKLYDKYEVENGRLVWKGGKRGVYVKGDKMIEVEGLTDEEIRAMKRDYEIFHGSYRSEEAIAMEATIVGTFMVQLKKYFFTYIKNNLRSLHEERALGKFEQVGEVDGKPLFEWKTSEREGLLRTIVGSLMTLFRLSSDKGFYEYINASEARRKNIASVLNTAMWVVLAMIMASFMDDEENNARTRWAWRIVRDISRGLHPMDTIDFLKTPIVAASQIVTISQALWTLLSEGIWEEPTKSGYRKGAKTLLRNLPGTSSAVQMNDLFLNEKSLWR